jgi:hypothetical protein
LQNYPIKIKIKQRLSGNQHQNICKSRAYDADKLKYENIKADFLSSLKKEKKNSKVTYQIKIK